MEHAQFKANLTAATYVSHGLDERAQEEFELHLMCCAECVEDVESWRAIEKHMPQSVRPAASRPFAQPLRHWRMAASLVGIGILGGAGGWYGHQLSATALEGTAFFNAPALTRGTLCTALKYAPDTQRIVVRVAGIASDRKVVALAPGGQELHARGYRVRRQSDGSWLLQLAPATLARGAVRLQSEAQGQVPEPLGCLSAQPAP